VATVSTVYADDEISPSLCQGANLDATSLGTGATCDDTGEAGDKINQIIKLVINVFSLVVGVVSVIMIIIGGLKYITSGGESGNITGAKNTILYAIIGLVVVALAQVIVKFVLAKATATV
jgi:cytochrome bd-type quinol oxidase subunit 2